MGMDDSYSHRLWDDNMALVETPLILPANSHYSHHYNAALYPYNLTAFQGGSSNYPSSGNGNGNGAGSSSIMTSSSSSSVDNIFIDTMNGDIEENVIQEKHSSEFGSPFGTTFYENQRIWTISYLYSYLLL